jgi:Cu(I)/Ag(I) efflux system membrane fusion protein
MVTLKKISYCILVIIIAALSFRAGGLYWQSRDNESNSMGEREILYYIDPMTPGYRSDEPGIAPCGMPLEPVYAEAGDNQESYANGVVSLSAGAVKVSPARQQLIGVNVKPVEVQPMTYKLRLYGKLVTDETRTYRINASTDSWVRKLSDVTTGDIVKKNQILAEVLAPAFYNAQVTYLVALDNVDRIMSQLGGQLRHQQADIADNQIRMAVQNLQNLGITDGQIEELATLRQAQPYLQVRAPANGVVLERNLTLYQWFKAGEEFFTVADIGRLWVYADVYEDEIRHLKPGMDIKVQHLQLGQTFDAKVAKVLPLFDTVAKTLKVRIDIDNAGYELRPDMFVDIEIPITMPPSLHLPTDAVIDSGTRKIVYVDTGKGVFEPREIATGWRLGRQIEITEGLMPGEHVVVAGNFLIDSESRMKVAVADTEQSIRENMRPAIDPVCGMLVDKAEAEKSGRTAVHEGHNVYFCMTQCRDSFLEEPEKYAQKIQLSEQHNNHQKEVAAVANKDKSWLEMLDQFSKSEEPVYTTAYPGKDQKDDAINLGEPGVIDWSGVDKDGKKIPPREWRKGWGTFPGSKYLGQKHKNDRVPDQIDEENEESEEMEEHAMSGHVPDATDESSKSEPMHSM